MSPEGLALIGPLALSTLRKTGWRVDAIGGLTLGADPISYAISYASAASDHPRCVHSLCEKSQRLTVRENFSKDPSEKETVLR